MVQLSYQSGSDVARIAPELGELYAEVYAEPPYEWGAEHVRLFLERLEALRHEPGFALLTAEADQLVGFVLGVTLLTNTSWWSDLVAPLPPDVTEEWPGRTFAVLELLVRAGWRGRGVGRALHHRLLSGRHEERATLTALPEAKPAQAAYARWGWQRIGQRRNPLPGSPVFDILLKRLR